MNLNGKAVSVSAIISFLQSIAVTYYATTPHPASYWDLVKIEFVMSWIISLGGVTIAAHLNFRDPDKRTREEDIKSLKDLLDQKEVDKKS